MPVAIHRWAIAALVMLVATVAQAHDDKDPRHIAMTGLGQDMKAIATAVKGGTALGMAEQDAAKRIAETARRMQALFPAGSGGSHSRAKPEIWSDREGFAARVTEFEAASSLLVEAVASGHRDPAEKALEMTGATCSSCHKAYRKPKKH